MRDTRPSAELSLRLLTPADCERLLTWVKTEDDLWQWSGSRSFTWPLDLGQLLRDLDASGGSRTIFAAVDDGGEMAGHVMLDFNRHHRQGLIGRVAIAPEQRGCGLGTALMRATVRHGFDDLELHRLQLTVYTFNTAAIACYRGVGFVVEGLARDSTRGSTGYWDGLTMSLLEPDYRHPLALGDGIRIAGPGDAERVAALLSGPGRPRDRDATAARLLAWAAEAEGTVLVTEVGGLAAGFVAVCRVPSFEHPGCSARVVSLGAERPEIRERLLQAARRWAAHRGCGELEVSSSAPAGA